MILEACKHWQTSFPDIFTIDALVELMPEDILSRVSVITLIVEAMYTSNCEGDVLDVMHEMFIGEMSKA